MTLPLLPGPRAVWITGAIVAALVLLRACVPLGIEMVVEARLAGRDDVTGEVDDVDVSLWPPAVVVQGLHLHSSPAADHDVTLDVDEVRLHSTWHDLLRGDTRVDVALTRPRVRIEALGHPKPRTDPRPPTLAAIRSIAVEDGEVTAVLHPFGSDDVPLSLRGIDVHVRETAPQASAAMTGRFVVDAQVESGGDLHLEGAMSFVDPTDQWTTDLAVNRLEIPPFNPLLRTLLGVDAECGRLSLEGRLTSTRRLLGTITPRFEDLALYATGEHTRRPMTEAIFSEMLRGADGTIPIGRPKLGAAPPSGAPLEVGRVTSLMRDIIRRGYDRRLDELDGYTATVGGLEIDLEAGLLSFVDITIVKDHTLLPLPFFHTDRMQVRIDTSVVDARDDDRPPLKEVTLTRPTLTFVQGPTEATRQMKFDPQWPDKVSALPYPTETVHVIDGRVQLWHLGPRSAAVAYLSEIQVDVARMYSATREVDERQATFTLDARVMGDAPLHIAGAYRPGAHRPDLQMEIELEAFELARLNPLARALLRVDVSSGTAELWARIDTANGDMLAQVEPKFRDIEMIGADEDDVERPLAEFLIGIGLTERASKPVTVRYTSDAPIDDLPGKVGRALVAK